MWKTDCRRTRRLTASLTREGIEEVQPYNVAGTRVVTLKMKSC